MVIGRAHKFEQILKKPSNIGQNHEYDHVWTNNFNRKRFLKKGNKCLAMTKFGLKKTKNQKNRKNEIFIFSVSFFIREANFL